MAGSISSKINNTISSYSSGNIFTYSDFNLPKENELALAKTLSRLVKKGEIVRIEKGKYYRPRKTSFGNLRPDISQIVKLLTRKDEKVIGYPTGIAIYNQLGLTTQMSNVLVIATVKPQLEKEISGYRVKFVKRDFEIEEKDIPLLQLLDAIKDINNIPDTNPDDALKIIVSKIKELPISKLQRLTKLALNYNAATRAMVGAILQQYIKRISVSSLYKSLNSLTRYKMRLSLSILPNQIKWNIE
jgi:hypothetical protein